MLCFSLFDFNYFLGKKIFNKSDEDTKDLDTAIDRYADVKALIRGLLKFAYNAS